MIGRVVHLTEEQAAQHNVPREIEEWRLELGLAIQDPERYSAALATEGVGNAHLYASLQRIDAAAALARVHIDLFVPSDMADEFHDCLEEIRDRVIAEGLRRGLNLVSMPFSKPVRAN